MHKSIARTPRVHSPSTRRCLVATCALALGTAGCEMAMAAAFPEAAAQVQAQEDAAWNLVKARYAAKDGYEDVGDVEFFLEEMKKNPRKMKFCLRPFGGSIRGSHLDEARGKYPEAFDITYTFWIDDRPEFFAITGADESALRAASARGQLGRVCVWASGEVKTAGAGYDAVNVYQLDRWDGVMDADEKAAEAEVAARKPAAPPEQSEQPRKKKNLEVPPEDDDE